MAFYVQAPSVNYCQEFLSYIDAYEACKYIIQTYYVIDAYVDIVEFN